MAREYLGVHPVLELISGCMLVSQNENIRTTLKDKKQLEITGTTLKDKKQLEIMLCHLDVEVFPKLASSSGTMIISYINSY